MSSDWFEEMEKDEQERDAYEHELSLEYKRGKAEGYREAKEKYLNADAYNEGIADGRESAIDEFLSKAKEKKYHSYITRENAVAIAQLDWIAEKMKGQNDDI